MIDKECVQSVPHRVTIGEDGHLHEEILMDEGEPRVRRRGMFLHVETPELDDVETESAEGLPARIARRRPVKAARNLSAAPDHQELRATPSLHKTRMNRSFRFATATGSRRLSQMSR
jgi:hypothetical protein